MGNTAVWVGALAKKGYKKAFSVGAIADNAPVGLVQCEERTLPPNPSYTQ
jgi:hypothetical protein